MTAGIDIGASAVKVVVCGGENVLAAYAEDGRPESMEQLLLSVLDKNGIQPGQISLAALTGVGAESCPFGLEGMKAVYVPELEATGEGGTWLAGCDRAVVVGLGTGTSLVLAKDGAFTHVGGSGVGSGTVRGLAKGLLGITDVSEFIALAEKGDLRQVDIQIRDLFSGTDTLPLDLTASNLAKCKEAEPADWAAGILNLALEVAGSHGALACAGFGVDTVIITGGLSTTEIAAKCYAKFDRLYPQTYIIPPHSGFATAIGAVRRAERGV